MPSVPGDPRQIASLSRVSEPNAGLRSRRRVHPAVYAVAAVLSFATILVSGLGDGDGAEALLRGPDDYMRLVQVRDWLGGQAWTDLVQHRLNPPAGVPMHWSRLGDLPLAAATTLADPWLGRDEALRLGALVVPPLLGAALVAAFLWAAGPLAPARPVLAPMLMSGALVGALTQFRPGRIDHHGLQLVLVVLLLGLLLRAHGRAGFRPAAGAGIVAAVSLAVGMETLPLVFVVGTVLAGAAVARRDMAGSFAAFGAALAVVAAVLWATTVPLAERAAAVCDRMSLVHVAGACGVAAVGGAALALSRRRPCAHWPARLLTVAGLATVGLLVGAAAVPQCIGSPYANLAPEVYYWFELVNEAQSLVELFGREPGLAVAFSVVPAAAAIFAIARLFAGAPDPRGWRQPGLAALALVGVALMAWQIRTAYQAGVVGALVLVPLAAIVDEKADRLRRMLVRVALRLCVPAACFAAIALPGMFDRWRGTDGDPEAETCDLASVLPALTDPGGLGDDVLTVAAPIDLGPAILLLTRHGVLAAPYHRNVRGLADNRLVFAGTEAEARATVGARDVGVVVFCRKYARATDFDDRAPFLDQRLAAGHPPAWLAPVVVRDGIGVYRVERTPGAPDEARTPPRGAR